MFFILTEKLIKSNPSWPPLVRGGKIQEVPLIRGI